MDNHNDSYQQERRPNKFASDLEPLEPLYENFYYKPNTQFHL